MASNNNNPSDVEFLVSCIRHGEMKIDFTKVNDEHGWTNRSKSQIKYKNILKAHGLDITGNERYKKPVDNDVSAGGASPAKTPRKRDGKDRSSSSAAGTPSKKAKTSNAGGTLAASEDASCQKECLEGVKRAKTGNESEAGKGEGTVKEENF